MNNNNITFRFQEKIERANKDFSLFDGAEKILVGLSGGADSTSLLISLKALSKKYAFTLYAVHVNHMIRGIEADRDEAFARQVCQKYGVEFFSSRVNVPLLAEKTGESLELCARNARYEAFSKVCRDNGISCVATAHNACDNSETVLFNLVRGSGTKGLCGIPPKRTLSHDISVIRPLIYLTREEIEAYLEENGQDFVTDSTNESTDYSRNFIRQKVMPLLRELNPSLEDAVTRTSRLVSRDEAFLEELAENVSDDVTVLSQLSYPVLSRVVKKLYSGVSSEMPSEKHINELCSRIYGYDGNKVKVSFPDSFCAKLQRGRLTFEKDERVKRGKAEPFAQRLVEGGNFFEENPYALYITFDKNKDIPQTLSCGVNIYKLYNTDYLYSATIQDSLVARNRRDADKILSGKMHKSLKRIFNSLQIEERNRNLLPVIEYNGQIILVPGVCKADGYSCDSEAYVVSVSLYIKDNTTRE